VAGPGSDLCRILTGSEGSDRILFGCDYPPEPDLVFTTKWIDSVSMSDSDREKICHLDAERLFRI
jgi:predicted TIM-barrel fold metal-dependent hydrolase